MRAAVAVLFLAAGAGCSSAPGRPSGAPAEGRIIYRAQKGEIESTLELTTADPVRIAEGPVRVGRPSRYGETFLTPEAMGTLLAALESEGFFALPGKTSVPAIPGPRSITVDLATRKFYVTVGDLRDAAETERYRRAALIIIGAASGE